MKTPSHLPAFSTVLCVLFIARFAVLTLELPATKPQIKKLAKSVCNDFFPYNKSVYQSCQENFYSDSVMDEESESAIEVPCWRGDAYATIKTRPAVLSGWNWQLVVWFMRGNDTDLFDYALLNATADFVKIKTFSLLNYSIWSTLLNSDGIHSPWRRGPEFTTLSWDLRQESNVYEIKSKMLHIYKEGRYTLNALFNWDQIDGEDLCYEVTNYCPEKPLSSQPIQLLLQRGEKPSVEVPDLPLGTNCTVKVQGQRGFTQYVYRTPSRDQLPNPIDLPERVGNIWLYSENSSSGQGWDVTVSWVPPRHLPQQYNVTVYTDIGVKRTIVVPQNATEAILKNVTGKFFYNVGIASIANKHEQVTVKKGLFPNAVLVPMKITSPTLVAATAITTLLTCVSVAVFAVYWYRRRNNKNRHFSLRSGSDKLSKEEWLESCGSGGGDWSNNSGTEGGDQWEVAVERVTLHEVLGEGAFGLVRRGTITPASKDVAVKMLKEFPSVDEIRSFRAEMELMKGVGRHAHVVGLVGCCSGRRPLILVEYCAKGDLLTYLRRSWDVMISKRNAKYYNNNSESMDYRDDIFKNKRENAKIAVNKLYNMDGVCDPELTIADLLSFCRQIALGMEFLASNRVVHRDLAARNILVTEDKTLKIADFGLSRDVYQENQYKQKGNGKMPVKWMALESLTHKIYTTQSDVWSFGVVMWEVVTVGGSPYAGVSPTRLLRLLRAGYRLPRPANCTPQLYEVMCSCWAARAHARPTFGALVARLDAMLHAVSAHRYLALDLDPADRDQASPHTYREKYLPIIDNMKRVFGLGVSYERPRDTVQCNHYTTPPYALPALTRNDRSA